MMKDALNYNADEDKECVGCRAVLIPRDGPDMCDECTRDIDVERSIIPDQISDRNQRDFSRTLRRR